MDIHIVFEFEFDGKVFRTMVDPDRYSHIEMLNHIYNSVLWDVPVGYNVTFKVTAQLQCGSIHDLTGDDTLSNMFSKYEGGVIRVHISKLIYSPSTTPTYSINTISNDVISRRRRPLKSADFGCTSLDKEEGQHIVGTSKTPPAAAITSNTSMDTVDMDKDASTHLAPPSASHPLSRCEFKVGDMFEDVYAFKTALEKYVKQEGFERRLVKNEKGEVLAVCKVPCCSWRLYASRSSVNSQSFAVKTYDPMHSCKRKGVQNEGLQVGGEQRMIRTTTRSLEEEKLIEKLRSRKVQEKKKPPGRTPFASSGPPRLEFTVGDTFDDVYAFRTTVEKYVKQEGFQRIMVHNEKRRVVAICKANGCTWKIYAAKINRNSKSDYTMQVRSYNKVHTCVRQGVDNSGGTQGKQVPDQVTTRRMATPPSIQQKVTEKRRAKNQQKEARRSRKKRQRTEGMASQ